MEIQANFTSFDKEGELIAESNLSFDICFEFEDDGTDDEESAIEAFFSADFDI
jgi:hypothetical protein